MNPSIAEEVLRARLIELRRQLRSQYQEIRCQQERYALAHIRRRREAEAEARGGSDASEARPGHGSDLTAGPRSD